MSRDSSVGIAKGYGLEDWGSIRGLAKIVFSTPQRPDRLWGPHSLLSNGYLNGGSFHGSKVAGAWN
jgi:hypothetical protein